MWNVARGRGRRRSRESSGIPQLYPRRIYCQRLQPEWLVLGGLILLRPFHRHRLESGPVLHHVLYEGARRRGLKAAEGEDGDRPAQPVSLDAELGEPAVAHLVAHGPRGEERDPEAALHHELDEGGVVRLEGGARLAPDLGEELVGGAAHRVAAL